MASIAERIDRLVRAVEREHKRTPTRERALAITKLQEARLWIEEDLKHNPAPA